MYRFLQGVGRKYASCSGSQQGRTCGESLDGKMWWSFLLHQNRNHIRVEVIHVGPFVGLLKPTTSTFSGNCLVITACWRELYININNTFGTNIPFQSETMYLGDIAFDNWNINDKKLLYMILLVASKKKTITRKWLRVDPPTMGCMVGGSILCMRATLWKIYLSRLECKRKSLLASGLNGLSV